MADIVVEWEVAESRSAMTSVPGSMPASEADAIALNLARALTQEGGRVIGTVRWYLARNTGEVREVSPDD